MDDVQKVPLLGLVAAGQPMHAYFADAEASVKCDFALRMQGDSMVNARIFCGDVVFVCKQQDVVSGQIAVVEVGNETMLRRVYKYDNRIELRPENPMFAVQNFEGADMGKVRIVGRVVAFQGTVR